MQVYDGNEVRKNVNLIIRDDANNPVFNFTLYACLPKNWNRIQDKSGSFDVIELTVQRLEMT